MNRALSLISLIILGLAVLAPFTQLILFKEDKYLPDVRVAALEKWEAENRFLKPEILSENVIWTDDQTLRERFPYDDETKANLKEMEQAWDQHGVPYGRSHPPLNSEWGANIVVDGYAYQPKEYDVNSFWSFHPYYLPTQLDIEILKNNTVEDKEAGYTDWIDWIYIIPRYESWKVAYKLYVLERTEQRVITKHVVPLHYHGKWPVRYLFSPETGNGIRLIIDDATVPPNNSWAAPIYEIGMGCEGVYE